MTAPEEFDDARVEQMLLDPTTAPQPLGRVLGELRDLRESEAPIPSNELSAFFAAASGGARSGRGTTAAARVAGMGVAGYAAFAASAAAAAVISAGTFGMLPDSMQNGFSDVVEAVTPFEAPRTGSGDVTGDNPTDVILAVPESKPTKPTTPATPESKPSVTPPTGQATYVAATPASRPVTPPSSSGVPAKPTTPKPVNPPVTAPPVTAPPVVTPPIEQPGLLVTVTSTVGGLLGGTLDGLL